MNLIAITQRVDANEATEERRDVLDQRWTLFLEAFGACHFSIPNQCKNLTDILKEFRVNGIILTGGGNLSSYSKENVSLEREAREKELIEYAIESKIPLIGICRGMQALAHYFGIPLQTLNHHDERRHSISIKSNTKLSQFIDKEFSVNSYHRFAPLENEVVDPFRITALCGNIAEAIEHRELPLYGIMWHPEREYPFREEELSFFGAIFKLSKV